MRLIVHVEGETEEQFVNRTLMPHLVKYGFYSVSPRRVGIARQRLHRQGIKEWSGVRKEIVNHLRGDPGIYATTFVDYYGLPDSWPGRGDPGAGVAHAQAIEAAMAGDVGTYFGSSFDSGRFLPYLAVHEFEALLFSDCGVLAEILDKPNLQQHFQSIHDQFANPEEINDSPSTAPSKRILAVVPNYQKPLTGNRVVERVGLAKLRSTCPHFDSWITRLEQIPKIP
jgi:hypothetical protein